MKIRSRGAQVFNVPNTKEGHVFLKLLRKFRNRGWYYKARGRGSRKEHGSQDSIPQEHAEWLAVYMTSKNASWQGVRIGPLLDRWALAEFNSHSNLSLSTNDGPAFNVETGWPCDPKVAPSAAAEEEVELTQDEQTLLAEILVAASEIWAKDETMDSLVNKLVD